MLFHLRLRFIIPSSALVSNFDNVNICMNADTGGIYYASFCSRYQRSGFADGSTFLDNLSYDFFVFDPKGRTNKLFLIHFFLVCVFTTVQRSVK